MSGKIFSDVERYKPTLIDLDGNEVTFTGQVRNYDLQMQLQKLSVEINNMQEQFDKTKSKEEKNTINQEILDVKHRILSIIFSEPKETFRKYSDDLITAVIADYGDFYTKKFQAEKETSN